MAAEGVQLTVLTPKVRALPAFPRIAALVWLAAVLLSVLNPTRAGGVTNTIDGILKVGAIIAGLVVAAWLEESVFVRLTGRPRLWRVAVALLLPLAFLLLAALGSATIGVLLTFLGDDGTTVLSLAAASLWAASAATGSLVVVLIDVVVSALVQSFRKRIQLAVLILVGLTSVAAGLAAFAANRVPDVMAWAGSGIRVRLPERGELQGEAVREALADPHLARVVALVLTITFVALSLPAVLSACGKLADAVMERLHPLSRAFESLGQGTLGVRVEEAGSRDFRLLNRSFNSMVEQLALSRNMERAFGQYVSGQVLARIREQHGEATLPAELREASVFFADVRGFTSMSEKLEPAEVLGVLNRYFERVVEVIDAHEGYLDKFIGDAVVAVFNGPIDQADHAERAVRCAIALQQEVARLNQARAFPEAGDGLQIGVGVSTGPLVAGNLGSAQHMEYTVIGDTVNLAARLTGQAPAGQVWVNAKNAELLPDEIAREQLAPFSVKGKAQPVVAYRVWPPPGRSLPPGPRDASTLLVP